MAAGLRRAEIELDHRERPFGRLETGGILLQIALFAFVAPLRASAR